jgi:Rrf2 family protein
MQLSYFNPGRSCVRPDLNLFEASGPNIDYLGQYRYDMVMLRISRRTDYAVRVMIAAARVPRGEYMPSPLIGEEMLIPHPFMVKVVGDLRRSGLIATAAGRTGGIKLARPAVHISLLNIVEAVEGPIALTHCLVRSGECPANDLCPAHHIWTRVQGALRDELEAITLADLAQHGYVA